MSKSIYIHAFFIIFLNHIRNPIKILFLNAFKNHIYIIIFNILNQIIRIKIIIYLIIQRIF